MTTITAPKSGPLNWLEGFALTAVLQGLPIFAATPLIVKLMGEPRIGSPALFVTMATIFYSLLAIWAGSAVLRPQPVFSDKIAGWRAKPMTSVQLVGSVLLLSLLAVSVG